MATIGHQPRDHAHNTHATPGVGVYNIHTPPPHHPNYAPFMSLESRFGNKGTPADVGPGAYDVHSPLGSPSFTKYESDNNIIIKINDLGSSAFVSGTNRFAEEVCSTPGPGQYQTRVSAKARRRNPVMCKLHDHPVLKMIKQQNKEQKLLREKQFPRVGGGDIKPKNSLILHNLSLDSVRKPSQGAPWSMSKVKRFHESPQEPLPNPSVVLDRLKRDREKEQSLKPSPFFRSQTVKSYFDELTFETSSNVKMSIRKQLNYKSSGPAPGTYEVSPQKDNQRIFQFFGSTQERFKSISQSEIGPGEYFIPSGFNLKPRKLVADTSRRTDFQSNEELPGPGAYNLNMSFGSKKPHTNIEEFGSLEPRFRTQEDQIERPVSPSINLSLNYDDGVHKSRTEPKKRSNFLMKPKERCMASKQQSPPFAEYDVQNNDMGRVALKKRLFLNQLEECFLKKPAFDSSVDRFQEKRGLNQSEVNIYRLYEGSEEITNESSMFKSSTVRTAFNRGSGPGVGRYALSKPMIQDTFNTKYGGKPHPNLSRLIKARRLSTNQ